MNEATIFENLMTGRAFEVDDRIEQAYRAGVEAGRKEYEEKHWSECRQISEYEQENRAMKGLLREALPLLRSAFFGTNFMDIKKADELYDRITKIVGKEE